MPLQLHWYFCYVVAYKTYSRSVLYSFKMSPRLYIPSSFIATAQLFIKKRQHSQHGKKCCGIICHLLWKVILIVMAFSLACTAH